jgi:hypothetical protein
MSVHPEASLQRNTQPIVVVSDGVARSRDDLLVRRVFVASLAGVYLIAFVSLWLQIDGLVGSRGILPAQAFLDAVEQELGIQRWWRLPTLAWLTDASDVALHGLCVAGVISSLLLLVGVAPAFSAAAAWLFYLSLYSICGEFLSFQWDILLLEAGFLAIFYAPPLALSPRSRAWSAPPSRPIVFLLRLLIAKLMFLSGVVKLAGGDPTWRNLTALTYHYETTCLPTWTGWAIHLLPLWFHQISAIGMFCIELVVPFLAFGPRRLRLLAAAAFAGLMFFIGATGNYGFFNLLAVVLCLPLLDDRILPARLRGWHYNRKAAGGSRAQSVTRAHVSARGWPSWVTLPLAAVVVALTLVPLTRAFRVGIALPTPLLQFYHAQARFQLVNGYGLFARMTTERPEIILEGSHDGNEWQAYDFRWKPGDLQRRSGFVQPHMPRLDWQMWFAALGNYRSSGWFLPFCQRLLQGAPPVLDLLASNPFPDHPPRYLRAAVYDYHFTTWAERRATGAWWRRDRPRAYAPVMELSPDGRLRAVELGSSTPPAPG